MDLKFAYRGHLTNLLQTLVALNGFNKDDASEDGFKCRCDDESKPPGLQAHVQTARKAQKHATLV